MPRKNFISLLTVVLAISTGVTPSIVKQAVKYDIPADKGGSQLDSSAGLGEPLNVCYCNSQRQERSNDIRGTRSLFPPCPLQQSSPRPESNHGQSRFL